MISKEQVQNIGKLARISLTEEEIGKFQKEFSSILDYFEVLKSVDTSNVQPMTHSVNLQNVAREDQPRKTAEEIIDRMQEQFPAKEQGYLKVKSILKKK